jgi:rhomboid family GlyGly-CTERM serine protease
MLLQLAYEYGHATVLIYHNNTSAITWLWQWLTPSLIHASWMHWFLNILNLIILVGLFYPTWSTQSLLLLFGLSSSSILCCLYYFSPHIHSYVGMSGVLYTLAVYGAIKSFQIHKFISSFVLIYISLKLFKHDLINKIMGVDKVFGNLIIATDVHWYGAIIGIVLIVATNILKHIHHKSS